MTELRTAAHDPVVATYILHLTAGDKRPYYECGQCGAQFWTPREAVRHADEQRGIR